MVIFNMRWTERLLTRQELREVLLLQDALLDPFSPFSFLSISHVLIAPSHAKLSLKVAWSVGRVHEAPRSAYLPNQKERQATSVTALPSKRDF